VPLSHLHFVVTDRGFVACGDEAAAVTKLTEWMKDVDIELRE